MGLLVRIVTSMIADLAVATAKIADAAVTAAKLAADAVETAKIKDGAVTLAKLASKSYLALDWVAPVLVASSDALATNHNSAWGLLKTLSPALTAAHQRLRITFEVGIQRAGDTGNAQLRVNGVAIKTVTSTNADGYDSFTVDYDATALLGTTPTIELWGYISPESSIYDVRVRNLRVYSPQVLSLF